MASQLKFPAKPVHRQTLSEQVQPFLAEIAKRSVSTEAAREVPKENIDLLRQAGFFRAMVPAAWGGDERDMVDFCEGVRTVVKACPATGWVSGVLNVHPAGVPLFDASVQKEVWATGPDTIISSSGSPVMKATLAEGGIRVTGRGRWSSGCDHAEWAMVGVKVPNVADGQFAERNYSPYMFMAHRSEFEIDHDSWHSTGMRGTGSKDLVFDNLFVPSRRMERLEAMSFGFSRGAGTVDSWIARSPFALLFGTFLPAVALGCADGMIEEFIKRQRVRKNNLTGAQGILNAAAYMRLAEARHEIDGLTSYYHDLLWKLQNAGARGDRPNEATFQSMHAPFNYITDRAVKTLSRLFEASGASAIADFNPMQRYWRDGHAARLHLGSDYDTAMQNHGRSLIGLPPTPDL